MSLVSYENEINETEKNADKQAYNWMVDEKYYKNICCKDNYRVESEKNFQRHLSFTD